MLTGAFSETGFEVVADNSLDLLAGTQAAGAGMISANVHRLGTNLHADLGRVQQTIINQASQVSDVNRRGFDNLQSAVKSQTASLTTAADHGVNRIDQTIDTDMGHVEDKITGLETISAMSVAVTAAGFAATVAGIVKLRGDVKALHRELLEVQRLANSHLESLVDYASRTLTTQERILETLVNSRTAEAQQLIRQGWDNLKGGFDDDAFIRFEKSLEYDNTVYFTHAELARIYEKRGAAEKAEEHHRRAIVFSAAVNEETKGYASVQYAAFLERQQRLDDCVRQARNAVEAVHEDGKSAIPAPDGSARNQNNASNKSPSSSVGWRFYLAEMLVKSGKVESGLEELKTCIQKDVRFFEAAMASASFKTAQPMLSQLLVKLDAEQRAKTISPLNKCEAPLNALDILDSAQAKVMRATAAQLFEDILPSTFANLKKHWRDASILLAEIEAAIAVVVTEKVSLVTKSLLSVDEIIMQRPKVMNGRAVTVAAFSMFIIACFSACIASFVNQPERVLAFLTFVFCGVSFMAIYCVRSLSCLDELLVWKGKFADPVKAFEKLKRKCLREFSAADALYKAPQISDAVSQLASQTIDSVLAKAGPMPSDESTKALKKKYWTIAVGVALLCCFIVWLILQFTKVLDFE
ncbi:MAG: hypothetical protein ABSA47_13600 [Verrucomicrobiota bacterium]|jgi:tetratricopeptide (TPR) repeat protein